VSPTVSRTPDFGGELRAPQPTVKPRRYIKRPALGYLLVRRSWVRAPAAALGRGCAKLPGGVAGPRDRRLDAGLEHRTSDHQNSFRIADTNAVQRSTVERGTGPAARMLSPSRNATNSAICVTRREARGTGFYCGPVAISAGVAHRSRGRVMTRPTRLASLHCFAAASASSLAG
jgi:hypothetical protein